MAFMASKKKQSLAEEVKMNSNTEENREETETLKTVSSCLYLKPSQTLDKDQILRRIRHRKRINKVNNALQTFLSAPSSVNSSVEAQPTDKFTIHIHDPNWFDAFSAP